MEEASRGPGYDSECEITSLVSRFEACTLPRSAWTHAAHLTVALWYLTQYNRDEAVERIRRGIQKLNLANGVMTTPTGGYHETITLFWIHQVRHYLKQQDNKSSLLELANGLVQTYANSKLPLTYYSRERLFSPEARFGWIEPDGRQLEGLE